MNTSRWIVGFCCLTAGLLSSPSEAFSQNFTSKLVTSSTTWSTRFADIQGDSTTPTVLDMVCAPESGRLFWAVGTPNAFYPPTWNTYTIQAANDAQGVSFYCWSVYTADMDADGDQDVIGGAYGPNGMGGIAEYVCWWEHPNSNILTVSSWTRHIIHTWNTALNNQYMTLRWAEPADIDADGDLDIACAGQSAYFWLSNGGTASSPATTFTFNGLNTSITEGTCAHPCQLDSDSALEIVCVQWTVSGGNALMTSYGGGPTSNPTAGKAFSVDSCDWDADGDKDILMVGSTNTEWHRNDGGGTFTLIKTVTDGGYYARWGDLDGDGDKDICLGAGKWYQNQSGGTVFASQTLTDPYGSPLTTAYTKLDIADLDGDGDYDLSIPATGSGSSTYWYRHN